MKYLVIAFLFLACTKTISHPNSGTLDNPSPIKVNGNIFTSNYLVKDLDSSILSITLEAYLYCYAHEENENTRPCDIFAAATVNLSKPLQTGLKIEVIKQTHYTDSLIVIIIQPNQTEVTVNTGFSLINNIKIPDVFRIQKVTAIPLVN
jgi:hypothetical protein